MSGKDSRRGNRKRYTAAMCGAPVGHDWCMARPIDIFGRLAVSVSSSTEEDSGLGESLLARLRPRSIAVFRALQLGDMLCAVPALRALRGALPRAEITLVGLPWAVRFAKRFRHYVDDFIRFPGYPNLPEQAPELGALPEFLDATHARRFDLALQLHGSGKFTNAIVALFGARQVAGFCPETPPRSAQRCFLTYPERESEVRRLLRLAEFLGAPSRGEHPEFPLQNEDWLELEKAGLLRALPCGDYACLHPGARDPSRRWPPERFAQVGDALHALGLQVVLTGAAAERELTSAVARAMRTPPIDTASDISIGALAALLARARLLVSNDTGVSHVAAGLRLPSVVIFRASEMERWAPHDDQLHRRVLDPAGDRADEVIRSARALLEKNYLPAVAAEPAGPIA